MSGQLNFPQLGVPMVREVQIFRAFEKVLRNDPTLSPVIKTWVTYNGNTVDTMDIYEYNLCPSLKMFPGPITYEPITEIEHITPLTVQIAITVKGTNIDDLGNLFGAVRHAVWVQGDPRRRDQVMAILDECHATRPVLRTGAFTIINPADTDRIFLLGFGSIDFNALIDT